MQETIAGPANYCFIQPLRYFSSLHTSWKWPSQLSTI